MFARPRSLAIAALVGALSGACSVAPIRGPDGRRATPVVIGTGSIGGVYHSLGGAVCRLVNLETPRHGLACRSEDSPGSLFNVQALRERDVDLAVIPSDIQRDAVAGRGPFARQGASTSLRAVFSAHEEPFAIVVRAGSGIRTAADLAGKRVNLGNRGSGHRVTMERLLEALGLTRADFTLVTELAPREQNDVLCADRVDALLAAYPEYSPVVIPAGTYPGLTAEVRTFGSRATVVTTAAESDTAVYEIVRAAFAPLDARDMARVPQGAPLHPGAARYYRERGWLP